MYRVTLFACSLLFLVTTHTSAQGLVDFNSEAIEDDFVRNFNLYGERYTQPVLSSFSFSQVNAWQYSAEVLKPWAFRIGFVGAVSFAPSENITFSFNEVGFSDNLELQNPSDPILVSALGGPTDKIFEYTVQAENGTSYTQEIPAFSGFSSPNNAIPNLVPQIGLGLPQGFQVTARFSPYVEIDDVSHSEFGIGLSHDIAQYFKGVKNLGLSVGGFYDVNQFNYKPVDFLEGENQNIQLISNAFLVETAASYKLGFLDVMASLGFYSMVNSFQIEGTYRYEVEQNTPIGPPVVQEAFSTTDPISIETTLTGVRLSTGVNLNLGSVVDFGIAYHLASVNTISASLGFAILNSNKNN